LVSGFIADLESRGLTEVKPATLETIQEELSRAEDELVTGNVQVATARLVAIVESPRFQPLAYSPSYQNAELTLGRALLRGGAYASAERYLTRVLAHGPKTPFFAVAYRALVDIALETRDEGSALAKLDAAAPQGDLPIDSQNERLYLAGKVAYERGGLAEAETSFSQVQRQSRFFGPALYFRGLIQARQRHFASARASLCQIVEQTDKDKFAFFVDGRYWAVKDLAYLALGRIAHEQNKYDDAYYFFFQIPQDSDRLADALYEAAWSMFQKGEFESARTFVREFDKSFPGSPLSPDVLLLAAMIDLKSCKFDRVRTTLDTFVQTYSPVESEVERLLAEPGRRRALYRRLLSRENIGRERDTVLDLLKLDPRFFRYVKALETLDRETGRLPHEVAVWDELTAAALEKQNQALARGADATDAVALWEDAKALVPEARGDVEMEKAARDLVAAARKLARPVSPNGPFAPEADALLELEGQTRKLRGGLVDAIAGLAESALVDLDKRLRGLMRQARLTHIDAVIGKKKRLEIEIANLQEGRFPADMFAKLQLEGLIGDDEEYWPFEGEYWADEYENFK
jgi:tetratricopeptide (TPR) repeat protein